MIQHELIIGEFDKLLVCFFFVHAGTTKNDLCQGVKARYDEVVGVFASLHGVNGP